tara:strand:- start:312 stop:506 length:195 start_codon:yes stop_codon:yes gene_type:complete
VQDKIKAARSRAQASGVNKKKKEDRPSWFDEHVAVIGANKEQEDKIKKALQDSMAEKQIKGLQC